MDHKALFSISYGLYVVGCLDGERPTGCVIDALAQISSEPLRIMVALMKSNYTHDIVKASGKLCVSVLSEDAEFDTFKRFGFQSGRDVDKFAGFPHSFTSSGLPYVTVQTNAYFAGHVVSSHDMGSHTVFFVDIDEAEVLTDKASITYADYRLRVKPQGDSVAKSPEKSESTVAKKKYRCTVCGFEVEFADGVLPDDYVCPLCGVGADKFELVEVASADESGTSKKYRCVICGYEAEFADGIIPEGYTCPLCGVGAENFEAI